MDALKEKIDDIRIDVNRNEFALIVKKYRSRNGLSQTAMANKMGVSRSTICEIEAGRAVSWMTAYKVFNAMQKNITYEIYDNNRYQPNR